MKPVATLEWSLHVDCAKCGVSNDLANWRHDPEDAIANAIFSNDWDKLNGWEVDCEHCGHKFTLERIEY